MQYKDKKIDIFLSHDWPSNISKYGNVQQLIQKKKFLSQEIFDGTLGSPPAEKLLHHLQPEYWFSAHLHVKFPAVVTHENENEKITRFLALDKCLPHRDYMQILHFPEATGQKNLSYDQQWLAIVKSTNHLLSLTRMQTPIPHSTTQR
jgi:lariat debranching enzyme